MKKIFLATILFSIFFFPQYVIADDSNSIDLNTYVRNIRNEFMKLQKKEDTKFPMFIEKISLEMSVTVKADASGGVKFYVLEAGGSIGKEATQKINFDLYFTERKNSLRLLSVGPKWLQESPGDHFVSYKEKGAVTQPFKLSKDEEFAYVFNKKTNTWEAATIPMDKKKIIDPEKLQQDRLKSKQKLLESLD